MKTIIEVLQDSKQLLEDQIARERRLCDGYKKSDDRGACEAYNIAPLKAKMQNIDNHIAILNLSKQANNDCLQFRAVNAMKCWPKHMLQKKAVTMLRDYVIPMLSNDDLQEIIDA